MINEQIKKQVTAERLEIFLTKINLSYQAYMGATFPTNPLETIAATLGPKYARVMRGNSAYAFIELSTGDIFKPASWKAPAKHARGNIEQPDETLFGEGKVCGPHSVRYL